MNTQPKTAKTNRTKTSPRTDSKLRRHSPTLNSYKSTHNKFREAIMSVDPQTAIATIEMIAHSLEANTFDTWRQSAHVWSAMKPNAPSFFILFICISRFVKRTISNTQRETERRFAWEFHAAIGTGVCTTAHALCENCKRGLTDIAWK